MLIGCSLPPAILVCPNESLYRAVVGPFHINIEETGRQFASLPVIAQAVTANAFSVAWLIGTVTVCLVLLPVALSHTRSPSTALKVVISCCQFAMVLGDQHIDSKLRSRH